MKTRKECWELIEKQMDGEGKYKLSDSWHYGKVELKELMDFIYGEYKEEEK